MGPHIWPTGSAHCSAQFSAQSSAQYSAYNAQLAISACKAKLWVAIFDRVKYYFSKCGKQTLILIKTLSCMIIFLLGCGKYSELLSKTGSMCLFKIQFYSIRYEYFQLDCDFIYVLHSTSYGHLKEEEEKSLLIFKGLSIYILLQQTLKCTSYEKDSKIEIRFK